jgi:hypothetical protein
MADKLQVTVEEQAEIAALPQKTDGWYAARNGDAVTPPRLTASNFGAAVNHDTPSKRLQLLTDMLWPQQNVVPAFARKYMQYGNDHEDVGRRIYEADRRRPDNALYTTPLCRITETGLVVSLEHGWLGASPDGIVEEPVNARSAEPIAPVNPHHLYAPYTIEHPQGFAPYLAEFGRDLDNTAGDEWGGAVTVRGGLEIKCPAAGEKVLYSGQKQHQKHGFPWKYFDQIQGAMAVNGWPWNDTVVFTPTKTEVIRFHRDTVYWDTVLLPGLKKFYFQEFLPLWELKRAGKLATGSIAPRMVPLKSLAPTASTPEAARKPKKAKSIDDPLLWFAGHVFKAPAASKKK